MAKCPIGAEPWATCPKDRDDCCAAVCPYYHPERHESPSTDRIINELEEQFNEG